MIFSNTLRAVWNLALMWSLLFLVSRISYEYSWWRLSLHFESVLFIYLSAFDHFFLCFPFSSSLIYQMSALGFLFYHCFQFWSFLSVLWVFYSLVILLTGICFWKFLIPNSFPVISPFIASGLHSMAKIFSLISLKISFRFYVMCFLKLLIGFYLCIWRFPSKVWFWVIHS